MEVAELHSWNLVPEQARRVQEWLKSRLVLGKRLDCSGLKWVAGADVSYSRERNRLGAAIVLARYPELEPAEIATACLPVEYPYIPGLLAFREGPVLIEAFRRLRTRPDVILFDGQGIAHPRGLGIASHMGVLLGIPTVGVAKKPLVGEYKEPEVGRGSRSDLMVRGELVGQVVRTKTGVKPVFVSPGNLIDLDSAVRIVLECCRKMRLPEPVRWAHMYAGMAVKSTSA